MLGKLFHPGLIIFCAATTAMPLKVMSEEAPWKIEPLVEAPLPADAVKVPFLKDAADTAWHEGNPVWSGESAHAKARCWMAASHEGLRFYVTVSGPAHENAFHDRNLWRGDCLYLDLDARGNREAPKAKNLAPDAEASAASDADDILFIFALTDKGPEGQQSSTNPPVENADCTGFVRGITRDEASKTTTYDLAVPWTALHSAFGQSSAVGVALNAAEAFARPGKLDVTWGELNRQFNRLALPDDPDAAPFANITAKKTRVLDDSPIQVEAAWRAKNTKINVRVGERQQSFTPPADSAIGRCVVFVPSSAFSPQADAVTVHVAAADGVQATETLPITTPALVLGRLTQRLAKLRETAPNDLVRGHLDSTQLVIEDEYRKLPLDRENHRDRLATFTDTVAAIMDKLPAERFDFGSHVRRCQPLVFAFVSDADQSLQFAAVQLPFDWQPDGEPYPLTIYLHGYWVSDPIRGLRTAFDNSHQDTTFGDDELTADNAPAVHHGFILAPWARGNSWYRGAAATDVFQAMKWVEAHYKVDPNRRYMSGFSMGGSGAWALAAATPDLWAGVNITSGFGPWSAVSQPELMANAKDLPASLWVGGLEGADMQQGAHDFQKTLIAGGNARTRLTVATDLPHTYPHAEFCATLGWLMQFTRAAVAPREFAFIATDAEHTGRNGIVLRPSFSAIGFTAEKAPRFRCRIDGNTVSLDTQNASGAKLALGADGLGLTGNVEVMWNGQSAYKGDAKQITLGGKRED